MSIAVRAKIIGMDPLIRKLRVLPEEARKMIRQAMEQEANQIVALMTRLAPERSGALRDSIGWTWGNKVPKGAMAVATKGKGDLSITIYAGSRDKSLGDADAFYVRWIEFGTAPHTVGGKFAGAEHPGSKAKPFFFPGWRGRRKPAKAALRKAARDAARKVAAK